MNHEGFQQHLTLVQAVLHQFGLDALAIDPVAYDESCKYPYNHFIYKILLSRPIFEGHFPADSLYCTKPTHAVDNPHIAILRLDNPKADGLSQTNRIENEVAVIYLARKGVNEYQPGLGNLVPSVYAWRSGKSEDEEMGWILMDFKHGVPLDDHFSDLSLADRKKVIEQIGDLLTGIQRAPLPSHVKFFGGLTFDSAGTLVKGPMITVNGGPWATYDGYWRSRLISQLEGAESSHALQGWQPNGVRQRVDEFISSGLQSVLAGAKINTQQFVLIHGDLTMNNMLFNLETKNISALLDFDFASVSHPFQEFFNSLSDIGGNVNLGGLLTEALLSGDFGDEPELCEEKRDLWRSGRILNDALAARKAIRPCDITGIQILQQLGKLEILLCPFGLVHPIPLGRKTQEQIQEERKLAEVELVNCLQAFSQGP